MRFLDLDRRSFLMMSSALGVGAVSWPWRVRAQDRTALRIRSYSDLQVLDPLNRLAQPEGDIMDAIFANLIKAKPGETWDWQLDAAEAIAQVDERHIDFTLKGIQFSGGFGELTAEDVKFSFERIADPENQSPYKHDCAALDRAEVKEPYHGTIVLKEPFAPLWTISLIVETDAEKRHDLYVRMQELMEESGAYVFLTHELTAAIYRDHIVPGLLRDGIARFAEFQLAK